MEISSVIYGVEILEFQKEFKHKMRTKAFFLRKALALLTGILANSFRENR